MTVQMLLNPVTPEPGPAHADAAVAVPLGRQRRALLARAAEQLLAGEDPDQIVLPQIVKALADESIIDASIGFVVAGDGLSLIFSSGLDPESVGRCLRLDFGQAVCGTVAATGRAMHRTNIQRRLDPLTDLVRSLGINAYACEPLMSAGRVIGTLSFATRSQPSFSAADLQFFRELAKLVAAARARSLALEVAPAD